MNISRLLFLLVVLLLLTACGTSEAASIQVHSAWARPTVPGVRNAGFYMTISNDTTRDDALVEMRIENCLQVSLHHSSVDEDRTMEMSPAQKGRIAIPAGKTVVLEPGSFHAMCVGLGQPLQEGQRVPVTLVFEKAGTMQVPVDVMDQAS